MLGEILDERCANLNILTHSSFYNTPMNTIVQYAGFLTWDVDPTRPWTWRGEVIIGPVK